MFPCESPLHSSTLNKMGERIACTLRKSTYWASSLGQRSENIEYYLEILEIQQKSYESNMYDPIKIIWMQTGLRFFEFFNLKIIVEPFQVPLTLNQNRIWTLGSRTMTKSSSEFLTGANTRTRIEDDFKIGGHFDYLIERTGFGQMFLLTGQERNQPHIIMVRYYLWVRRKWTDFENGRGTKWWTQESFFCGGDV